MKKIILFNLFLLFGLTLFAQSKLSPDTRVLVSTLKSKDGDMNNFRIRSMGSQKYVSAYVYLNDSSGEKELENLGVKVNTRTSEIVTALIPVDRIEAVAALEAVKYVQIGTKVHQLMDKVRTATMADSVFAGHDLPQAFMGTGVVIGVIDGGFDYGHPAFYNLDKNAFRVKRVWNQNDQGGTPPEGFTYGTELKTEEEILNAGCDRNDATHGTHVAGIASGADTLKNTYFGVAPDADLVFVSMSKQNQAASNVEISDGIKYIYDYAESVGKPCVINMSLGTHVGPHDGTSSFDKIADILQGKGKLLVGAVGNEGDKLMHVSKTFGENLKDSLSTFIQFIPGIAAGNIDIWGDEDMKFTLQFHVYKTSTNKICKYFDIIDVSDPDGNEVLHSLSMAKDYVKGTIHVVTEISPINNKPHAYISLGVSAVDGDCYVAISIKPQTPGSVNVWTEAAMTTFDNYYVPGYVKGNNSSTAGEIGGSGKKIISVGAYTSKNRYNDFSGQAYSTKEKLDRLVSYSSCGPTPDGRMKPDITAPGSMVASAISNYYRSAVVANKVNWQGEEYIYGFMEGTSMAAPCVTGILATWLQASPDLTPERVRRILKETAIRDSYTGEIPDGDNKWGFGKINAWEGIKAVLLPDGIEMVSSSNIPGIVIMQSGESCRILFTKELGETFVLVYDLNGMLVHRLNMGKTTAGEELSVNLGDLSKGLYIVKVQSNQALATSKISVK